MAERVVALKTGRYDPAPEPVPSLALLRSVPSPLLLVDADDRIVFANGAAETLFSASVEGLASAPLDHHTGGNGSIRELVRQVRREGGPVAEYDIALGTPRVGDHRVDVDAAHLPERRGWVLVVFHRRSLAEGLDGQHAFRGAARSMSAMSAVLAHEVKNPLAGIRGAAQLLESAVAEADQPLARLIQGETDRICGLIDSMEAFEDLRPRPHGPVNIHQVLDHVRRVAATGWARHVRFVDRYDPSLPPVLGDRDRLIQAFLNLVKNAAEAVTPGDGEIVLATAYRHDMRTSRPGGGSRAHLPLEVAVEDNGPGLPGHIRAHVFDPFVSARQGGSGLGLALVAKIVADHGGVIRFDSEPGHTVFRTLLPAATAP